MIMSCLLIVPLLYFILAMLTLQTPVSLLSFTHYTPLTHYIISQNESNSNFNFFSLSYR